MLGAAGIIWRYGGDAPMNSRPVNLVRRGSGMSRRGTTRVPG